MRIGLMVLTISLAASSPALLLAQPASPGPASQPTTTAQTESAAGTTQQAAPSATVAQSAAVAQASSQPNLDEIVCRSEPPATGTRLGGGRECHTVRQWNERQREDQLILQQQQKTGFGGGN